MTFYYHVSYDENTDEFFAMVDDGYKTSGPIFTIDDTDEMVSLIETKVMEHIDDVDGLKDFLVKQDILKPEDDIMLVEKALV